MIYKRVGKKGRRMEIGVGVRDTDSCIFIGVEAYAQYGFVCAVTRASFAGFSRWRIHVVENGNESMPLGQWSSFLRSPYFFQLLIQIDRTSLFCITDALASDMNRYLFARSFTSLSLWDLSCSFSFSFSFSSSSYSSYTSKERFSS